MLDETDAFMSDCGERSSARLEFDLQVMTVLLRVLRRTSRTPPLHLVEARSNGHVLCVACLSAGDEPLL